MHMNGDSKGRTSGRWKDSGSTGEMASCVNITIKQVFRQKMLATVSGAVNVMGKVTAGLKGEPPLEHEADHTTERESNSEAEHTEQQGHPDTKKRTLPRTLTQTMERRRGRGWKQLSNMKLRLRPRVSTTSSSQWNSRITCHIARVQAVFLHAHPDRMQTLPRHCLQETVNRNTFQRGLGVIQ